MKEYIVVSIVEISEFIIAVNKYMESGWQPIGGVSVTNEILNGSHVRVYAQALVK